MFTKRITALLGASGLAAAGFLAVAAAPAASASTVPVVGTKSQAGFQASGRDYRYITSVLTVPDTSFLTGVYPSEYLQLSNGTQLSTVPITGGGDEYVRAGIMPCAVANHFGANCSGWTAFVSGFSSQLNGGITVRFFNLANVSQGDGIKFSMYYDQSGQELHFVITPPNASGGQQTFYYEANVPGAIFDHAGAIDDFTDGTGTPIPLPFFLHAFRINQFLQGSLTTYSGVRGSFTGPWVTSMVEATSNGLPYPSGTVRVSPNGLFSDGASANGAVRSNDAFGVWAR